MRFDHPAWRSHPLRTGTRMAQSLVRKRVPSLRRPVVGVGHGVRMRTDLGTAMGLYLYRYGVEEERDVALCCRVLKPGDRFIDGGANVGMFSIPAAARVGREGKVLAFEPVPGTAARLRENAALNGFSWVEVREEAIAAAAEEREFVMLGGDAAGLSAFTPEHREGGEVRRVRAVTLDDVAGDGPVRLIKLDLEGAEVEALRGGGSVLARQRPDLLLEVVPGQLERAGSTAAELFALVRAAGYRISWIAPDGSLLPAEGAGADPTGHPNVFASAR